LLQRPWLLFIWRYGLEVRDSDFIAFGAGQAESGGEAGGAKVRFASNCYRIGASQQNDARCHVWTAPGWQEKSSRALLVGAAMCSACLRGSHDRWP
jgi:hypothetical protein